MSRRLGSVLLAQLNAARRSASLLPEAAALQYQASALTPAAAKALPAALASCSSPAIAAMSRSLTTSPASLAGNIVSVLQEEIKHERAAYAKPEEIASGPPAPFTLSEASDGDTLLTLKRAFNGEEVCVDLHVNNQPAQEFGDDATTNDEGEALSTVAFNVTVTKKEQSLVFECESDGTYVAIMHLSHEPKGGHDSESFYTGPVFAELDETLQQELRQYLQDRGITEELGEYLRHLIYDKEQREYMAWLEKVQAFVK